MFSRKWFLLSAAYMGLIWVLSSRPGEAMPPLPYHLDKAAHLAEYAGLGWLLGRAFGARGLRGLAAAGLAALYGLTDEWHQAFVAGREASAWDWAADAAGSVVGVFIIRRKAR